MKYDIHGIPIKIKFHDSQRIAESKVTKDGEVGMIQKGKYRAKFTIRGGVLWVLTIEED
jgi:hypothetical protein